MAANEVAVPAMAGSAVALSRTMHLLPVPVRKLWDWNERVARWAAA